MQYTRPDFMYTAECISSYIDALSATEFQGSKKLIRYLDSHRLRTIIYPSIIVGTIDHELRQEVSPGNFY